jgi:hypothetical protein
MECKTHDLLTLRISGLETISQKKVERELEENMPRVLLLMIIIVMYSAITGSVKPY